MSNMQHGIENEKNGLATLMGKVMPVFYPGCIFQDDDCMKKGLPLNRSMVISGDGSIMMKGIENVKTTVEIKCPVPGKVWTTDTYYQIRTRYSTQVMSAMDAKCCADFVKVCYTHQSTTVITGGQDAELFHRVENLVERIYCEEDMRRPTKRATAEINELK